MRLATTTRRWTRADLEIWPALTIALVTVTLVRGHWYGWV